MLKVSKNAGFASFVEIVMTTGIFLITAVGIYSTIAMISPKSVSSTRKLEAAYAAKNVYDQLYSQVSAATWNVAGGGFEVGRQYTKSVGGFTVIYNFEIPAGFGGADPEKIPLKLNIKVDY